MSIRLPKRSWQARFSLPANYRRQRCRALPVLAVALLLALITAFLPQNTLHAVEDPDPIYLSGNIDSATFLTKEKDAQGRLRPYQVTGDLRVSAMLRIEPGVEIIFESGTSIILVENGALTRTLDAGSSDKIIFRGYQRTPGYWDGIVAEYGSRGLQLRHCDISDAKVAVRSETKAPSIRDCTLQHNEVGLAMTVHGHLLANGVSFMGRHEIPGSWIGMLILQDGSATLQDCQILYAGDTTNHTRFRGTAVHIETSEFVSMHGCTIRDSASMAVDIAGGADVDIRGNNIYNNKYGLNGTALSGAIYSADSSTSLETTEPPEADFIASTRIPVDARFSWWGHPSGPTNTAGNPDGQGTPITGNVIFSPWAKSPVTEFNPGEHQNLYLPAVTR